MFGSVRIPLASSLRLASFVLAATLATVGRAQYSQSSFDFSSTSTVDLTQYPNVFNVSFTGGESLSVGTNPLLSDGNDGNNGEVCITLSNLYQGQNGHWFAQVAQVASSDDDGTSDDFIYYGVDLGANPLLIQGDSPGGMITYGSTGLPEGTLDGAAATITPSQNVILSGWAVDFSGGTVAVKFFGATYGFGSFNANRLTATPYTASTLTAPTRNDLVTTYGLSRFSTAGWAYSISGSSLPAGNSSIYAYAVSGNVATYLGTASVSVSSSNPANCLTAIPGAGVAYGQPIFLAWQTSASGSLALSGSGISTAQSVASSGTFVLLLPPAGSDSWSLSGTGVSLAASETVAQVGQPTPTITPNVPFIVANSQNFEVPASSLTLTASGCPSTGAYHWQYYIPGMGWSSVVSGPSVTFPITALGGYNVTLTNVGDSNYIASQQTSVSFNVAARPTVTASAVGSASGTYGTSNFTVQWSGNGSYSEILVNGNHYANSSVSGSQTITLPAGTATVSVIEYSSQGLSSLPATVTYSVAPEPATFTITPPNPTYSGQAYGPTVSVSPSSATFTVANPSEINAGTYTTTATATGNYAGTAAVTWTIHPDPVTLEIYSQARGLSTNFSYSGSAIAPGYAIANSGTYLVNASALTYMTTGTAVATAVGSYQVTVSATGNYTGSATLPWSIQTAGQSISLASSPSTATAATPITLSPSGSQTGYNWTVMQGGVVVASGSSAAGPITVNFPFSGSATLTIYAPAQGDGFYASQTLNYGISVQSHSQTVTANTGTVNATVGVPVLLTATGSGSGTYNWADNNSGNESQPARWFNSDLSGNPPNSSSVYFVPSAAGDYSVSVNSPGNNVYAASAAVNINLHVTIGSVSYSIPNSTLPYTGMVQAPTIVSYPAGVPMTLVGGTPSTSVIGTYTLQVRPASTDYGSTVTTLTWRIANPLNWSPVLSGATSSWSTAPALDLSKISPVDVVSMEGSEVDLGAASTWDDGDNGDATLLAQGMYLSDHGVWMAGSINYTNSDSDGTDSDGNSGVQESSAWQDSPGVLGTNPMEIYGGYSMASGIPQLPFGGMDLAPETAAGQSTILRGWAVDLSNGQGTPTVVALYLDGAFLGNATLAQSRSDISTRFDLAKLGKAGWTYMAAIPSATPPGIHTISALATGLIGEPYLVASSVIDVAPSGSPVFSAAPTQAAKLSQLTYGQQFVLSWNVPGASSLTLSGPGITGLQAVSASGSMTLTPPAGTDRWTLQITPTTGSAYALTTANWTIGKANVSFMVTVSDPGGGTVQVTAPNTVLIVPGDSLTIAASVQGTGALSWSTDVYSPWYGHAYGGGTGPSILTGFGNQGSEQVGIYYPGDQNYNSASFSFAFNGTPASPPTAALSATPGSAPGTATFNYSITFYYYPYSSPGTATITGPGGYSKSVLISAPTGNPSVSSGSILLGNLPVGTNTYTFTYTPSPLIGATATTSLTIATTPVTFSLDQASFPYTRSAIAPAIVPSVGGATFSASGTTTATGLGSYSLTAVGTGYYTGSTNLSWSIVQASQPALTLTLGATTAYVGIPLTVAADGGSGSGTYNWTLPTGVTGAATGATNSLSFSTPGSYTITVNRPGDINYTAATAVSVTINVTAPPSVTFTAAPLAFAYDGSVHGPLVTPTPLGATFTTNGTTSASAAGQYTMTVTPAAPFTGSPVTFSWSINAARQPPVTVTPPASTVGIGQSVTLNAAGGAGTGNFSWTQSDGGSGTVSGTGNATYTTSFSASGVYTVLADRLGDSSYQASNSGSATVTAMGTPTLFTISSNSFTSTGAAQGPTITATPAGATFVVSTGVTSASAIGNYSFTVAANGNYSGGQTFSWSITGASAQAAVTLSPTAPSVGAGGSVTFTASGGSGTGAFAWILPTGAVGATQGTQNLINFATPGSYTISVYRVGDAAYATTGPVSATITVSTAPAVVLTPATATVTIGQAVSFQATNGANPYVWSVSPTGPAGLSGGGGLQSVVFTSSGIFTVSVYSQAGGIYPQSPSTSAVVSVGSGTPTVYAATTGDPLSANFPGGASGLVISGKDYTDVETISDPYTITAGPSVTVESRASITYAAGPAVGASITLLPGFHAVLGSIFDAKITPVTATGGGATGGGTTGSPPPASTPPPSVPTTVPSDLQAAAGNPSNASTANYQGFIYDANGQLVNGPGGAYQPDAEGNQSPKQ